MVKKVLTLVKSVVYSICNRMVTQGGEIKWKKLLID